MVECCLNFIWTELRATCQMSGVNTLGVEQLLQILAQLNQLKREDKESGFITASGIG